MNSDWQNMIVLVVVAAAIAYLARVAWLSVARRRAAACGGCGNCPTAPGDKTPQVVEIQALGQSRSGD